MEYFDIVLILIMYICSLNAISQIFRSRKEAIYNSLD